MGLTRLLGWLMFYYVCLATTGTAEKGTMICKPGERQVPIGGPSRNDCEDCKEGTYTSEFDEPECHKCSQVLNNRTEVVVKNCTRTNDTLILCVDGYHRKKRDTSPFTYYCEVCKKCEDEKAKVRPCQGYNDTVCCPLNSVAEMNLNSGQFECKADICGPGHFLEINSQKCMPCPSGTYMHLEIHRQTECFPCKILVGKNHTRIENDCTKTSPSIFGCQNGFSRDGQDSVLREVKCEPCKECSQYLVECGRFQDSICVEDATEDQSKINRTAQVELRNGEVFNCPVTTNNKTETPFVNCSSSVQWSETGCSQADNFDKKKYIAFHICHLVGIVIILGLANELKKLTKYRVRTMMAEIAQSTLIIFIIIGLPIATISIFSPLAGAPIAEAQKTINYCIYVPVLVICSIGHFWLLISKLCYCRPYMVINFDNWPLPLQDLNQLLIENY